MGTSFWRKFFGCFRARAAPGGETHRGFRQVAFTGPSPTETPFNRGTVHKKGPARAEGEKEAIKKQKKKGLDMRTATRARRSGEGERAFPELRCWGGGGGHGLRGYRRAHACCMDGNDLGLSHKHSGLEPHHSSRGSYTVQGPKGWDVEGIPGPPSRP